MSKSNSDGETHICSICGCEYKGFGNNAQPINDGRCCDSCNDLVVARRLNDIKNRKRGVM